KLRTKMREKDPDSQGYIFSFLRSISSKNSYRKLIANYYFIYSALEEALENHREHPVIAKIYFPELCRVKSLIQDLTYYYGPEWQEQVVPSEATQIYVDRIREVSKTEPELLVAYSYGHYMSDLSGGQILKDIAQMSMNLEDGNGLAFYNFESINDVLAFKVVYRQCLNDISVSEEIAERILDETTAAFARFLNVHHASEGSLIKAMIQLFLNRMLRTNRAILFEHRKA
ncbi:MAG: biliverdin-producing heme oxygenase, partial [Cyanobacteria bacterium P01_F01_bin.86]